jgi:glucose-6-phosphate 1-dehydrogenase
MRQSLEGRALIPHLLPLAGEHPAYYLAIPPALFATVIEGLGATGRAHQARGDRSY